MPQNTFDDKSILFQVMAWRHQAWLHVSNVCGDDEKEFYQVLYQFLS